MGKRASAIIKRLNFLTAIDFMVVLAMPLKRIYGLNWDLCGKPIMPMVKPIAGEFAPFLLALHLIPKGINPKRVNCRK